MAQSRPDAKFPLEAWDGLTSTTQDITTGKHPDIEFGHRYRAEIRSIEDWLLIYKHDFEDIHAYGDPGDVLIVDISGTGVEWSALGSIAFDHGSLTGLADDDHAQYHNDARAATWLGSNHESTFNHANYNTAYGWGDHAGLYDDAGDAAAAVSTHESTFNHASYDTAFGWGDHASGGYLKANGTVPLTGNMAVDALITIDGRDISVDGTALDTLVTDTGKVKVDTAATADYLGAASSDGVLRTGTGLTYTDGGNYVTITVNDSEIDHGSLAGLDDDDHAQYHNDSRAATWLGSNHESTFNHANFGTAYGWGNHASGGYLKADGSVELTGDMAVVPGVTIDGRDLRLDGQDLDLLVQIIGKMKVDSSATVDYLGAAFNDGVLRTSTGITYTDGGNFITLTTNDGEIDHGSLAGIGDDDHSQYHTDARAATWLAANHETTYNHANYDTAYGWGNHAGLYDVVGTAAAGDSAHLSAYNHANFATAYGWGDHAGLYQPLDADLTAIAALTATGGWAKRTGADTWSISTPSAADVGADASGTAAAAVSAHESTFNHANFGTAYGWGDHASGGYLKADGTVPLTADWTTGAFSIIGSDHWYLRADSAKMFFGAEDDASIHYDGTDMVLEPSLVGGGAVKIQGAGGAVNPLLHLIGTSHCVLRFETTFTERQAQLEYITPDQSWNTGVSTDNYYFIYDLTNLKTAMRYYPGTPPRVSMPNDDSKFSWGAADDCSISYDGTDMVLTPDEVGSGAVRVQGTGGDGAPLLHVVGTDHTTMRLEATDANKWAQVKFKTATQQWNLGSHVNEDFVLYDETNSKYSMVWRPSPIPTISIPNDDSKLFWGVADDCSISYDGNDMVLTPDEVGSGGLKVVGDMFFDSAGSGLPYGEIYSYDAAATITIGSSGIANKVQITAFNVDGASNLMTPAHGTDDITILKKGTYLITCSIASESTGGSSYKMGYGVWKNDGVTQFQNLHAHRNFASGGGGEHGSVSMNGIVALDVNDTIEVWCWNETNTANVVVDDITLSITMVGG